MALHCVCIKENTHNLFYTKKNKSILIWQSPKHVASDPAILFYKATMVKNATMVLVIAKPFQLEELETAVSLFRPFTSYAW